LEASPTKFTGISSTVKTLDQIDWQQTGNPKESPEAREWRE
jgi:hypothetical protein